MWFPSKYNQNQFKDHYTFETWNRISGVDKKIKHLRMVPDLPHSLITV